MYHKVIILEIKGGYALAMTEDGEIIRIKKKAGMKVGAAVYVLEEDRYKKVWTLQWQKQQSLRRLSFFVLLLYCCRNSVNRYMLWWN